MKRVTTIILIQVGIFLAGSHDVWAGQQEESNHTIVPGVGVGDYTLGMSKDEVLKKLGEPETILLGENQVVRRGEEKYDLTHLPSEYALYFGDISFYIKDDSLELISVRGPLYKLSNGLAVGDSQRKIKEAFGENFWPREEEGRNFFRYDAKGLGFEIDKKNQTVAEIFVYQPQGDRRSREAPDDKDRSGIALVRRAAAEGRISYKRTTPEEFKQIVGQPTKEQALDDGEVVYLEYPGVRVKFFGKPQMNSPVTILWVTCDDKKIDIGEDRYQEDIKSPLVQPFEDVRSKNLSRADLSSRAGLIATLTFNQETVWPEPARMPPGSDPKQILADGMNPGLGIRELHQQGITGKGVNVAIIDQPLFKDHAEYNGKIVAYYDTGCDTDESSMHGPAVASLLVGTHCGTAPDARVYYVAAPSWKADTAYYAKGLEWIIEQNGKLPEANKIRVVSVSAAPSGSGSPFKENREMWDQACARAEADGIMVLDCTNSPRGFINRGWYDPGDPENVSKFNLGPPPKRAFKVDPAEMSLYVPSSCRTTAQHYDYQGRNSYIYWARGGLSWSVPYCAGVLAMGWQIRPDLTPAQMKELLFESAYVHKSGAKIIYPAAFIELIRKQSKNQHTQKHPQPSSGILTIVPGVGVGDYTLGMNKDEVTRKLGEPDSIHIGRRKYSLNDLPRRYIMSYSDFSFTINEDKVTGITVRSPLYKFTNGLGVGDSEEKIKQAFGSNFQLEEYESKDLLNYKDKGIQFEIRNTDKKVVEIDVYQAENNRADSPKPKVDGHELRAFENVCGKDLRACDLRDAGDILDTLGFNQETLWPPPERLPKGFDQKALLQEGMNPGLGVRALHAQGITGAGVHVGLIDQPLLLDHPEYAGKIVSYYALDCGPHKSSGHGPGMASQLVGNRCGTAPGAKLHVVAVPSWKADASYYARALDRFVVYNENAPKEQKIRVVSVSCQPSGEGSVYKNQSLWDEAVQRAQDKGILVLDCTWHHGFVSLCWLDPANRESVEACTPGFRNGPVEVDEGHIHVPSAPRTVAEADEDGSFGYAYDGGGRRSRRPKAKNGYSDTIPYAAGILALGWQIRPDLTPAQMKELLFASAYVHESGARIIDPPAFIDLVRKQSDNRQNGSSFESRVSNRTYGNVIREVEL